LRVELLLGGQYPLVEALHRVSGLDRHLSGAQDFDCVELLGHDMDRASVDLIASLQCALVSVEALVLLQ
jgi:hypothetical protein